MVWVDEYFFEIGSLMVILFLVFSPLILALSAPWLYRVAKQWAGGLLALLPLGTTIYLISLIPRVVAGETLLVRREWVQSLDLALSFRIDGLSLLFSLMINTVGAIILVYSGSYLKGHPHLGRFYGFLLLFLASMFGLVLADNLIALFVFWELTSISSYLLIGFNHEKKSSRKSALQALLVTGLGGLALLAGFLLLGFAGGSYDISGLGEVREHEFYLPILLLILAGAFTKSAQVPFHFWLPSAMAAPTPVSAFLHSATMVKAGVYLLARLHPVLGETDPWFYLVSLTGAVTMMTGSLIAPFQRDLKLILAYATVAVLGMLTMLIGMGTDLAIVAAMVVMVGHALYKAALFLVAGMVDHQTGTRDVQALGGLARSMPRTMIASLVAAFSMAGLPPFFGFIGKELFLEAGLQSSRLSSFFVLMSMASGALLIAAAWKAGGKPFAPTNQNRLETPKEASFALGIGPLLLAVGGLAWGVFPGWAATNLIEPAAAAAAGATVPVKLSLWHGFNRVLALSALTLAVGAWAAMKLSTTPRFLLGSAPRAWFPSRVYDNLLNALFKLARFTTDALQGHSQRHHLTIIFLFLFLLGFYVLGSLDTTVFASSFQNITFYEAAIGAMILASALGAVFARSLLGAVATFGLVGYGVSVVYALYGAPDLAITQIVIETLTIILFVLVVYKFPSFGNRSVPGTRLRDAFLALLGGTFMTALVLKAVNVQFHPSISDYFVENSVPQGHGRNIVNVILVDFRALDTLGEITVLTVAALGVFVLLRDGRRTKMRGETS